MGGFAIDIVIIKCQDRHFFVIMILGYFMTMIATWIWIDTHGHLQYIWCRTVEFLGPIM